MPDEAIRLLVVDDEPQVVRALKPALSAAGYDVVSAATGTEAITLLAAGDFEILLLDLGLPDLDGKEVILRLREWSDVPILVLSARDEESEKIAALDLGANDFVNKPFAVGELLARIRVALRVQDRRRRSTAHFSAGPLRIDFADRRVRIEGEHIRLTPREYDLLVVLARHAGSVVTHKQLIAAVWGAKSDVETQFVRVLIGQVRQKVEEDSARPQIILTEPGIGYRLIAEDEGKGLR